jgi:hypothetical protein
VKDVCCEQCDRHRSQTELGYRELEKVSSLADTAGLILALTPGKLI